jgi:hypothetical protein
MSKIRPKVIISIDYTIRIPDFISFYDALKAEIFVGAFAQTEEMVKQASTQVENKDFNEEFAKADINTIKENQKIEKDADTIGIDKRNYWNELNQTDPAAVAFYKATPTPVTNIGGEFDLSYGKYFYSREHLLRFLQEYSFNLFGTGQVTNKADTDIINTAQSQLCDIILFDRIPYARKEANTFAFLSRSSLYVRSVNFATNDDEIKALKEGAIAVWDPKADPTQCIDYPTKMGTPTKKLLDFFMDLEKKING